ncbi:hypothetical protein H0H93_006206 [Arthromyces matolae]|nr:hypothetical protein H0H93_006206 [Arthromyces matolae]
MAATFMAAGAVLLYASKHGTGPKETKLNMIDNRRRVKTWGKYEIYIPPDVSGEGSGVEELGSGLENLLRLADAASHAQPLVVNDPAKSQQHTTSTSSAVPSAQSPRDQGQLSPKRLRETDPSEPILRSPKTQKFNPNTIASVLNHEQ